MLKRELKNHVVTGNLLNDEIEITVIDEPGAGGACTCYQMRLRNAGDGLAPYVIGFQNGPIASRDDVNGISNEALLAVLIDRLEGFANGPFRCRENSIALTHLETALLFLQKRTRDRAARGVEGTLKP